MPAMKINTMTDIGTKLWSLGVHTYPLAHAWVCEVAMARAQKPGTVPRYENLRELRSKRQFSEFGAWTALASN